MGRVGRAPSLSSEAASVSPASGAGRGSLPGSWLLFSLGEGGIGRAVQASPAAPVCFPLAPDMSEGSGTYQGPPKWTECQASAWA